MSNENNYTGVTIDNAVGNLAFDPEFPPYDKDGKRGYKQAVVLVDQGYKDKTTGEWKKTGTGRYVYNAPAEVLEGFAKGNKVRIDGAKQEVREYEKDGQTRLAVEWSYGTIRNLTAEADF